MTSKTFNPVSDHEFEQFKKLFARMYNAELISFEQGESITVAFDSTNDLLKMIGDIKPAMPRVAFNSKKVDGRQVCTISGIRGALHA
jgi:hypothetical protein